jgi:hypothetical protein
VPIIAELLTKQVAVHKTLILYKVVRYLLIFFVITREITYHHLQLNIERLLVKLAHIGIRFVIRARFISFD